MQNTKYFIAGGGTGGHIYPAIAIIKQLIVQGANKKNIFYLGDKNKLEHSVAKANELKFLSYPISGMPRKISFGFIPFAFKLLIAILKSIFYILKYKPDVVFTTGGFSSAPVLFAARILKTPYIMHDSDASVGIVTRLFAKDAKKLSLSFEDAKNALGLDNTIVLGNPIREEFSILTSEHAKKLFAIEKDFTILIMGGSGGARTINNAAYGVVEKYKDNENIQIIWQTGKKNYEEVKFSLLKSFQKIPSNLILEPYFENMIIPLKCADVAVSRSGSLSLSELCASSLPSILIPYPHAAADHQRKNARSMCDLGASLYLEDSDCNEESLVAMLDELINDKDKLNSMAQAAQKNAKFNATKDIAKIINEEINAL